MNNIKFIFIISVIVIIFIAVFLSQNKPMQAKYKYPSTYFIKPSENFLSCYIDDDCMKAKGSACPPAQGGIQTCINKDHLQEYTSNIELLAGKEWEVTCPDINNASNYDCLCINNTCKLVS
jgi:hypothetical protein